MTAVGPPSPRPGMGRLGMLEPLWGDAVGNETKLGLLVGLVFIVLFGVILGSRVGASGGDHAPLPVGASRGHRLFTEVLGGQPLDPLGGARPLVIEHPAPPPAGEAEPAAPESVETPMPAPADLEPPQTPAPAGPPAPLDEAEVTGRLAFGPVRVETPAPTAEAPSPSGTSPASEQAPAGTEPAAVASAPGASPTPAAAASSEAQAESVPRASRPTHVVAKGETLTAIARAYYGPEGARLWRRIWKANRKVLPNPNRLRPGLVLVIPGLPVASAAPTGKESDRAAPAASASPRSEDGVPRVTLDELARRFRVRLDEGDLTPEPLSAPATYTVRKGDTFYGIARKVYGDPARAADLVRANRDRVPDPTRLRVGQTIVLPGRSGSASGPQGPSGEVAAAVGR